VLLPWLQAVPATLLVWFPGQEAGHALADVLLGAAEPGGRLPTTWPASEDNLPSVTPVDGVLEYSEGLGIGYRSTERGTPLLPFGHGLGYTPWEYLGIEADASSARVTVVNAGTRPGREVVQVYAARPDSAVARPPLWLVGFATVEAAPGEQATAEIALSGLAHWQDGGWATEPGEFALTAGRSLADLRVHTTIEVG
jgi:beta-glucosidase